MGYFWVKNIAIALFGMSWLGATATSAMAETVMEKVLRTGKLTAGTSKDALPFAFRNEAGELVGYSIDILELITARLEAEYDRDIELELVALPPQERIPQLVEGEVDIVCDASSFTWERDRLVDFSFSYSSTGTRLLTAKGNDLWDAESLVGLRIGALPGTTNEQTIREVQPEAEVILMPDRAAGFTALRQGKIDAFVSDGILLQSWLQNIPNPEDFQIVGDYSREGIACMVPENNSQFLNSVNYTLVEFMQGFLEDEPEYVSIFDRGFGSQGVLPLTQDLRNITIDNILLLIDFKDRIAD